MRAALIPPTPELRSAPHDGFHLVLAHLFEDQEYLEFYQDARIAGDYLVLDNSAHELGVGQGSHELLSNAMKVKAQEIVLPDVLFDRRATIERTKETLRYIRTPEGYFAYQEANYPRCMIVPQGSDRADWAACLRGLLQVWDTYALDGMEPPVIGISKDYDTWRGGLPYLIGHYVEPLRAQRKFDVHCLGWPSNLWSLAKVARAYPWIRSTDSAKAYVYAKNGILLEPGGPIPQYPKRDENYFTELLPRETRTIMRRNVEIFKATASDEIILAA